MSTKKWLLGAIGGMLLAGAAHASMQVNVVLTTINGTPVDPAADLTKYVVKPGDQFQYDIYAKVFGADTNPKNEGIQSLWGSIKNQTAGAGQVIPNGSYDYETGEIQLVGLEPWVGNASKLGTVQPWGMGSAGPSDMATDYILMRSDAVKKYTTDNPAGTWINNGQANAGIKAQIGSFIWQATDDKPIQVEWLPAMGASGMVDKGALWVEDNVPLDAVTGQLSFLYSQGSLDNAPQATGIQIGIVPEPAGLSVLALGALGLLARRRK